MAKGKWAQGIQPRDFKWVIRDQLAICEKLGGFGEQHRAVRLQEEVIWVRERRFRYVISIHPGDDLTGYDELGVRWKHWPLPLPDHHAQLGLMLTELQKILRADAPILLHGEEVGEKLAGFIGAYLVHSRLVPDVGEAVQLVDRLMGRALGASGRLYVAAAGEIAGAEVA